MAKSPQKEMKKTTNAELGRPSLEEFRQMKKMPVVVVLDNVRSAQNVGAFFRTGDAFAVEKIALCGITATPPSRDIHKSSLGAEFTVAWEHNSSTVDAVLQLKAEGYTVLAIEQVEGAVMLDKLEVEPTKKYALVFGNEVAGVDQKVVDASDFSLEIPQYGTKHSLNVSVSVGVILWHFRAGLQKLEEFGYIDSNGNVTSVKEGECIITATASDGKIATCKVTVRPVDIESIQLDVTQKTLVEGEDFTFTVTITPTNATYKEITWMSSDSSVAVVDNNGKVTGIKEGNCVISAQTTDNKVVECDVTVKPVPVSSVTLSSSRVQMLVGDTRTLTYNVTPSHAKITSVVWSTDDESVATVSVDGVVTCKGLGTTKVTVLINGEYRAECLVHGAGIENFVSLRFGSSMVSSINGYLTGIIGCMLTNSSSQTITVKSLTIMDSYSGATVGQFSLDNVSVAPNTYIGRSIEIKIAVYKPIFRWVYIHDGKEYTIEITYEI